MTNKVVKVKRIVVDMTRNIGGIKMEKKTGKGKYYFLSVLPMLCMLILQALAGFIWSIIGSAVYMAGAISDGQTDVMNNMELYQQGALDFVMQYILYAVIAAQVLTLLGAGIWYGILVKKQNTNRSIKECTNIRTIGMCVCLGIGLQLVIGFFMQIAGNLFPDAMANYAELIQSVGIGETTMISMFATVVLAPVSEEIIFRGITLRFLKKAGVRFMVANVIQALFFGISHMNLVQGLYAFILGLVLGLVAEKCKSVFLPIILHFVINLSGTLLDALPIHLDSWIVWGILFLLGGLSMAAGFLLLRKEQVTECEPSLLKEG